VGRANGAGRLIVAEEVADALSAGRPVVALESTIISHGMPYPQNLSTAVEVEGVVRDHGAVPATVALVDGRVRVGLAAPELERLAQGEVAKASRRDLAPLSAAKATAGTTVAATMHLAHIAGIAVFATGGIGGVHRGAELSFDVSADLVELGRTPVAVVCAGAKAILDLPKTLEVLETQGVPVVGYRTAELPAFWSATSGLPLEHRVDSPAELAALILAHRDLGGAGVLVANPIPPGDALPAAQVEAWIAEAVARAHREGIAGAEVTPFLLARINDLASGRSLIANVALVRNNAALAAEVSVELSRAGGVRSVPVLGDGV
jgi:pseudouridine-5'-phosphate glycosidase